MGSSSKPELMGGAGWRKEGRTGAENGGTEEDKYRGWGERTGACWGV